MLDTLMAFWNQNRRRRARQGVFVFLLLFLLLCIGTSLLLILIDRAEDSRHSNSQAQLGSPTVPTFGNTVVPDMTSTASVVVGTQPTAIATSAQPSPVAKGAQGTPVVTPQPSSIAKGAQGTPVVTPQGTSVATTTSQSTPATTTTQPCVTTSSVVTGHTSSIYTNVPLQSSATPTLTPVSNDNTQAHPLQPADGGGPIATGTPTLLTPTLTGQPSSPPSSSGVPCTAGNSIAMITSENTLALLGRNIWLILGSSLLGTAVFYSGLFFVRRKVK